MDDLERRLQTMGDLLDELSTERSTTVGLDDDGADADDAWTLVEGGETADRHRTTRRWLFAAAALLIVGVAGYLLGQREGGESTTTPPTTEPLPQALVDECLASGPGGDQTGVDPIDVQTIVFPTDASGRVRILGVDDRTYVSCLLDPAAEQPFTGSVSGSIVDDGVEIVRSQVSLEAWTAEGAADGERAHVAYIGRVGDVVTDVDATVGDGIRLEGAVRDGWFVAEGDVPIGTDTADAELTWTLRSGTVRIAALDSIDSATPAEHCAVVDGCVAARIDALAAQAEAAGRDDQAAVLAEGAVTTDELDAAIDRTIECLADRNIEAGRTNHELDVSTANATSLEEATIAECRATHLDAVAEAAELTDAQDRFERDGPARGTVGGDIPVVGDIFATCAGAADHPQLVVLRGALLDSFCSEVTRSLDVSAGGTLRAACSAGDPSAFENFLTARAELTPEQFDNLCADLGPTPPDD